MKVGVVSQWFAPEPVHLPGAVANDLAERGHEVRVLTGFPNYPEGRLYPGYRQRWKGRSTVNGCIVRRVPLYPSHDSSGVRRAVNYLSFAATSSAAAIRFLSSVDVVYVYLTPATVFTAPAVLRLLRGVPAVIHLQDLWPESVTASSMAPAGVTGRVVDRILHAAMRRVYRMASSIAVISPSMRDLVVERGADPARVRVVLNWADEAIFRPVDATASARRQLGHRNRCTVMYAGAMGEFQNIDDSVRAAAAVESTGEVDLVLVGSGVAEASARSLATELGAGNVRFLGRRPAEQMPALYAAADYQVVTLRNLPIFHATIPSKLQAALACGSPVVVSVPGDAAALVENAGIGFACPPENWRALADRFLQAVKTSPADRAEMGRRARDCYLSRMSQRAGVDQLEEMLTGAAHGGPAR